MNGNWTTADLAGKPADVYDPPGGRPRFGILYLHSYSGQTLTDRPAFTRLFDELRLACVCPHGKRSWWADRVCAEFDPVVTAERYVLGNVLPFFAERWGLQPRSIGLLGVSMGGQAALRIGFKHPDRFPAVAAIAPAIDYHEWYGRGEPLDEMYDSKEQCRQDTATLHVHPVHQPPHLYFCVDPDDCEWYRSSDRLHEKLNALGVAHTCEMSVRAGGHSWDYYNAMAERTVRFLFAGLEQESRRLL